jgi:hypothetical protein
MGTILSHAIQKMSQNTPYKNITVIPQFYYNSSPPVNKLDELPDAKQHLILQVVDLCKSKKQMFNQNNLRYEDFK